MTTWSHLTAVKATFPELLNLLPGPQPVPQRCAVCVCILRPLCKKSKGGQTAGLMAEEEKKGLNRNGKLAASIVKINYLSCSPLSISPDTMTQEEGKNIHVNSGSRLLWSDKPCFFSFVLMPDYKMISQRACLLPTLHPPMAWLTADVIRCWLCLSCLPL